MTKVPEIHASLSFNLDVNMIQAALPLFEAEAVEGLEWSFDTLHQRPEIPEWFEELLQSYGSAGRLVGHGVYFSLFSGKWLPEQAEWLRALEALVKRFQFDHISEHFGFFTGSDFHKGAPLSVPYSPRTLAIGQDRLKRIADVCGCPVGLENLAFATDRASAEVHGKFLEDLLAPVNGFAILDLHNLYCQLKNFGLSAAELLEAFPLQRVREIHISGGSWEPSAHRPAPGVRRDTHDDRVPDEVFALLAETMPMCPNLKFVVMEQLGTALDTEERQVAYREDFLRMRGLVHLEVDRRSRGQGPEARGQHGNERDGLLSAESFSNDFAIAPQLGLGEGLVGEADLEGAMVTRVGLSVVGNSFLRDGLVSSGAPLEDLGLFGEQQLLSDLLERSESLEEVEAAIGGSVLAGGEWAAAKWDPAMLETAWLIARKWKDGF